MPCLVPGLHMKFPSLSVTDAWVTMQLHSSRKKQTRYNFVLQLMEQLKSVQQLSYFYCMFFFSSNHGCACMHDMYILSLNSHV